jgi:hypothetical protein
MTKTNAQPPRVLLIDLENCPAQIHQLMDSLADYAHVLICYAQSGAKISIDWLMPLTATVNNQQLRIIKMPSVGKNAADFGIAFWAGALMMEFSNEIHFDIVSNDNDLEHVVSLLKSQGRSATRIGTKKDEIANVASITPVKTANVTDYMAYLPVYCLHLLKHHNNRPTKKDTLLNSIKNKFQADAVNPALIVEALIKQGVLAVQENKITYNADKITKIAAL